MSGNKQSLKHVHIMSFIRRYRSTAAYR